MLLLPPVARPTASGLRLARRRSGDRSGRKAIGPQLRYQAFHRYSARYRDVVRARIVLLAADGQENNEIARRPDRPVQVVSKWRKPFFEKRVAGLAERSRTGHRRAFPPQLVVAVKAIACELPARLGLPPRGSTCPISGPR